MKLSPHSQARYFYSGILVILLSQIAICIEDTIDTSAKQKSQSFVVSTNSSTNPNTTVVNGTKHNDTEPTTKHELSTDGSPADLPDKTLSKTNLSHDNIPTNTGLPQHSRNTSILSKPQPMLNRTIVSSEINSSIASNVSSPIPERNSTLAAPIVPVHRKSKPEETTVDEIIQDSGPTTDYVVPLVVAMLAVPLVGVLCALLYMKGRDFWDRRHYGRIDFLWDSRNDSRMDFLIDGMYNN